MNRVAVVVLSFFCIGVSDNALACTKDTDCKGNRICVEGKCISPTGSTFVAPTTNSVRVQDNWASTAATTGYIGAALVLGGALAAEMSRPGQIPALPIGGATTLAFMIMGPVVASGAASARYDSRVTGSSGMRLAGWVTYVLTTADALALVGLGIADAEVPDYLITSVGLLGATSLIMFAIDAAASAKQASRLEKTVSESNPKGFSIQPFASPIAIDGAGGGLLGVFGRF